jgi:signal transduction histidine kinase
MVVIAEVMKAWVDDHVGSDSGFVIPYLGVIVAAVIGGLWPGLLATAIAAGWEASVWLPPAGVAVGDGVDQVRLGLFVLGGVLMSALCELGLRARASGEAARRAERDARIGAERAARRATALAELSAALNVNLSRDAIAHAALDQGLRAVGAQRGAFFLPDESAGMLRAVAARGYPPATMAAFGTVPLDSPLPAAEAARTHRQVLMGAGTYRARFAETVATLGLETPTLAMAAQPLIADGELLGVLGWAFTTDQPFDPGTAEFLEAIGSLTVQGIQAAAAFEREQTSRRQAEAANRRLDLIVGAGQALGASLDYEATLVVMARAAIPLLGDVCVADLLEEDGVRRFVAATDPVPPALVAGLESHPVDPASGHPVAVAMRDRTIVTRELDGPALEAIGDPERREELAGSGLQRFLAVPLVVRGRAIGALTFATLDPGRTYGDADISVAEVLAQRAAKAMENARLHGEVRRLASHERARAAELESVLAAIGEGIVVLAPDGQVHSANLAAERVLGGSVADLDELRARLGTGADAIVAPGVAFGPEEVQLAGRPATRVEVTAYATGADEGDADGRDEVSAPEGSARRGSVLVIRDVTAFRQGQGLREAFLGLLSHELRTPVTSIYAAATVLGRPDRGLSEEVRADILSDIVAESDRLYRLVEDLLVLARFDEGLDLVREPSLLQRVVPNVIASEAPRWPRTGLQVEVARDLPAVTGDETSIQQVIRNLVSNAAKYGPPGEPVDIVVDAPDRDGVQVRVLDRGPGISGPEMEAVFTPFYRSPATARTAGGAGIGLFVCRRLVEAMSGRIWARPREGGGSEFGFWLPRYVHAAGDEADDDPVGPTPDELEPDVEPVAGGRAHHHSD